MLDLTISWTIVSIRVLVRTLLLPASAITLFVPMFTVSVVDRDMTMLLLFRSIALVVLLI